MKLSLFLFLILLSSIGYSHAGVYKCEVSGKLVYQQTPCLEGKQDINIRSKSSFRSTNKSELIKFCQMPEVNNLIVQVFESARSGVPIEELYKIAWDIDKENHSIQGIINYVYPLGKTKRLTTKARVLELTTSQCLSGNFGVPTSSSVSQITEQDCGSKKACYQMINCQEARHYFLTCGQVELDADGDGLPCESLCN